MKHFKSPLFLIVSFLLLLACDEAPKPLAEGPLTLIPKPQVVDFMDGVFDVEPEVYIYAPEEFKVAQEFLKEFIKKHPGIEAKGGVEPGGTFQLKMVDSLPEEGYRLRVDQKGVNIQAADPAGAFWAVQTLRQLMPAGMENGSFTGTLSIPYVDITDAPAFPYRGMHLDVGRHFFDKEFIKEYIDALSMLKMNYFHWHLTEDQGWRIEIKKYPKLTSHAAYREETLIGHYNDQPQQFDGQRYGGFYTQEEIKEVVAYAQRRNVTIIPEIEMPGHAQAAVSAYPELGCTGEQIPVATKWGVFENIFCPSEATFTFLKDVLEEVIELFPGEYIHIGGDEAPKAQWKNSAFCQGLIDREGLKDEHELQSWFIQQIEEYLNSKGKKMIGWDEILEGGLAPNATVMSWRGVEGAVEAAKQGHDVILTPTSHVYFDYYQSDDPDEPLAIGGYLPLEKVYGFNPYPDGLTEEEYPYVLGAQGNVWTEYMPTTDQVEYMAYPRILAMSEVVWSGPSTDPTKDYPEFLERLEPFYDRLSALDINAANHLYTLTSRTDFVDGLLYYSLKTPTQGKEVLYQLDGSEFQTYQEPIVLSGDTQVRSKVQLNGADLSSVKVDSVFVHTGVSGLVQFNIPPSEAYSASGPQSVLNGMKGSDSRYGDSEWLGFYGEDLSVLIQFSEPTEVSSVQTRFYNANGQWIYAPKSVSMNLSDSDEGLQNIPLEHQLVDGFSQFKIVGEPVMTQQILLVIPNYGIIEEGKQGAGHPAWTFIDEIIIR